MDKDAEIKNVEREVCGCTKCPLHKSRGPHYVFGEGNLNAKLMLIGEAPGLNESLIGRPFVGRSGALLEQAFSQLNINREDLYIANIVKCRPPNNRQPTQIEIYTCNTYLYQQINIVSPKIICCLGSTATNELLMSDYKITKVRGQEFSFGLMRVIPTFHPSYILRNLGSPIHDTWIKDLNKAYLCTL